MTGTQIKADVTLRNRYRANQIRGGRIEGDILPAVHGVDLVTSLPCDNLSPGLSPSYTLGSFQAPDGFFAGQIRVITLPFRCRQAGTSPTSESSGLTALGLFTEQHRLQIVKVSRSLAFRDPGSRHCPWDCALPARPQCY